MRIETDRNRSIANFQSGHFGIDSSNIKASSVLSDRFAGSISQTGDSMTRGAGLRFYHFHIKNDRGNAASMPNPQIHFEIGSGSFENAYSGGIMKRPMASVGIAIWLCLMLGACAGVKSRDLGKEEFESKCATCHGVSGKGDGPQSQILDRKPADLTILSKSNGGVFPTQRVHGIIDGRLEVAAHGPRAMPIWGREFQVNVPDLPDKATGLFDFRETTVHNKIQALIDYLVSLQDMN